MVDASTHIRYAYRPSGQPFVETIIVEVSFILQPAVMVVDLYWIRSLQLANRSCIFHSSYGQVSLLFEISDKLKVDPFFVHCLSFHPEDRFES